MVDSTPLGTSHCLVCGQRFIQRGNHGLGVTMYLVGVNRQEIREKQLSAIGIVKIIGTGSQYAREQIAGSSIVHVSQPVV